MSRWNDQYVRADNKLLRETVALCRLYTYGHHLLQDAQLNFPDHLEQKTWVDVISYYARRTTRTTTLIRLIEAYEYNIVSSPTALASVDIDKSKIALEQAACHSPRRLLQLLRAIESYIADIPDTLLSDLKHGRTIPTYILKCISVAKVEAKESLSLKIGVG